MKQGKTLSELAAELERQSRLKADYVADTRHMHVVTSRDSDDGDGPLGGITTIDLVGEGAAEDTSDLTVLPHAHRQISDHIGMPWKFYERLRGTDALRELYDRNVNTLLRHDPKRRMLRTLDGRVRAFLSDGYRRLDNDELARVLLPILGEIPDLQIGSCELTDTRLYIKAFTPRVTGQIKVGEEVCAGVFISNSEVGAGKFRVEPFVYTLACTNGMVVPKTLAEAISRVHVGRRVQADEGFRIFRDETLQADDRAFFMAAADVVKAAVDEVRFRELVELMKAAANDTPVQSPARAVERLAKAESLTEGEAEDVLTHLARGGDLSRWGLLSAVTRTAEDRESYDRATELEELGGEMLSWSPAQWERIAA